MSDASFVGLFWSIALPTVFVGLLIVGAWIVEHVVPWWRQRRLRADRQWVRRLRAIESGRKAQGRT